MRLAAALLAVAGCTWPEPDQWPTEPGYVLRVEIDPGFATVVLEGRSELVLAADFRSFDEAVEAFAVPAQVTFQGMSRHEVIAPGYCFALAERLGLDLGTVYIEDIVLGVTSGLYLRPTEARCDCSNGSFQQSP